MRDYKYALEIMKQELNNSYICPEIKYAFEASIEALKKQIPLEVRNPINADDQLNKKVTYCFSCGTTVRNMKYCIECGQKLEWK